MGNVTLIDELEPFLSEKELGPDALSPEFDFAAFKDALAGSQAMVKSALMDQKRMAGIGNVYADEILFQARIHPKTKANKLDEAALKTLFEAMKDVLQTVIDHGANTEEFPDSYIIPQRHDEGKCPECGEAVKQTKVSGRTTYYCTCRQGEVS